jgi:hypothetical protein
MDTGYSTSSTPVSGPASSSDSAKEDNQYWSVERCKKSYLDYLFNKTQEIEEQKEARRYYHGSHWTEKQIKELKKRKQPVVTFNRIGRKIDGVIGLIERLRQDPKAYPRTPDQDEGAELATAVLRYVLDEQEWKAKSPEVARDGAVDGIGGVEIEIIQGDQGDPDVGFEVVEPDSFFYDPRSFKGDFSDARYMGVGKWMDLDAAIEMFPDAEDDLRAVGTYSSELSSNPDREKRWFTEIGSKRLVRLVEIWYRHKGGWCWAVFTGYSILMEGPSYLADNKKQPVCKYIMFSANVDHDGDRYGFVRNMKSAQDEYNHRRSKALHQINSKRIVLAQGAVQNIEEVRREWARPDGVVVVQSDDVGKGVKADDQSFDFAGQLKLMENAVSELDNYGPNQALIGDQNNQSGRAIQLLQQAGMAELGPFILGYRGWKVRLYRVIFNAVQKFWTGERYIRVTDNQDVMRFVALNKQGVDQNGQPAVMNPIGSLDVDIIIDEGPDTINAQQDVYETLSQILPSVGKALPPPVMTAAVGILIESSALPASAKKQFRDAQAQASQPNPMAQRSAVAEVAGKEADVRKTDSETARNLADARSKGMPEIVGQGDGIDPRLKNLKVAAEIDSEQASARHKNSQAAKNDMETFIAPHQAAHDATLDHLEHNQSIQRDRQAYEKQLAQTREPA